MSDGPGKWFTPEEAIDKWCPHARPGMRDAPGMPDVNCLASDCMAWRWVRTHVAKDNHPTLSATEDKYGYCGLAGDPALKL